MGAPGRRAGSDRGRKLSRDRLRSLELPRETALSEWQAGILDWFARQRRDLPWRRTRDPYAILVSEVMLQQTQVARVLPKYEAWLESYPDVKALAAAPLAAVLGLWQGLGYNNRAKRLHDCARQLVADGRELPADREALERLPGIGPYTARAILVFAHNADLAAVDTNVRRVLTHELDLPADLDAATLQAVAEHVLPSGRSRDWHNALMDYGAVVATARATGVSARSKQSPFVGSRRWQRSRLLRLLLAEGPRPASDLGARLDLSEAEVDELVELLAGDGLVTRGSAGISIA